MVVFKSLTARLSETRPSRPPDTLIHCVNESYVFITVCVGRL